MKGYVPTPDHIVDLMIDKLFRGHDISENTRILDTGCGNGAFIDGVIRWCQKNGNPLPILSGVELHPDRSQEAKSKYKLYPQIEIYEDDFLTEEFGQYDFIVGNPPYISIESMGDDEKSYYRDNFLTAVGRFDLYLLFWEKSINHLAPGGRIVYITPEKFLTVETARPLRQILANMRVLEVVMLPEDTFEGLTTYPTVTVADAASPSSTAILTTRNGITRSLPFGSGGDSLAPFVYSDTEFTDTGLALGDVSLRLSCGIATGADKCFVIKREDLDHSLLPYAYPTISGRQLGKGSDELGCDEVMLVPYDEQGRLRPIEELEHLNSYLTSIKPRLLERTCVKRKPWYAFHETPYLSDIMRPKIMWKDVSGGPQFWIDYKGDILPRHSVYYMVPKPGVDLFELAVYLNGPEAEAWLTAHCQRARKGFLRMQSTVLKQLPVPSHFGHSASVTESALATDLHA